MKKVIFVLLTAMFLVGCHARVQESTNDAHIALSVDTLEVGEAKVTVTLLTPQQEPVQDATVHITGDMSHAGMRAVHTEATHQGDGVYASDDFEFTMGGDWFITVEATMPDGTVAVKTFDVAGVASDGDEKHMHEEHTDQESHEHEEHMDKTSGDGSHEHMEGAHSHSDHMELPDGDLVPTLDVFATQEEEGWKITIDSNYDFTTEEEYAAGQGHAHVYVNDELYQMVHEKEFVIDSLEPGSNEIRVTLTANNHKELTIDGEVVAATTLVEVPATE